MESFAVFHTTKSNATNPAIVARHASTFARCLAQPSTLARVTVKKSSASKPLSRTALEVKLDWLGR